MSARLHDLARPLLHTVCFYPVLLPVPALIYALVWGGLLGGYDGFHMVWTEDPVVGVLNGFGVATILGGTVLGVFLLDQQAQTPPSRPLPAGAADGPADGAGPRKAPAAGAAAGGADRWRAYWVTWIILLLAATGPGVLGRAVGSRLDPFGLNGVPGLRVQAPGVAEEERKEIPLPPAAGAAAFEPDAAREAAAAEMRRCRVWFPLGLLLAAAAWAGVFAVARTWFPGWWEKPATIAYRYLAVAAGGYLILLGWHVVRERVYCPAFAAPVSVLILLGFAQALLVRVTGLAYERKWWLAPAVLAALVVPVFVPESQTEFELPGMLDAQGRSYYRPDTRFKLAEYGDRRPGGPADAQAAPPAGVGPPVADADALDGWAKRVADRYGGPRPLVVVSVSGGASASALYTADVLFTLELRHPGFADQVRVVTGASGGMLGAAYFAAVNRPGGALGVARATYTDALKAWREKRLDDAGRAAAEETYLGAVRRAREQALRDLGQDFLGPIVQKWVHKDIPLYFLPVRTSDARGGANDRGRALELAWDEHLRGPDGSPLLGVPLVGLREEERRGEVPSLVFTPMLIEDGRQLVVSNLDLDYLVDTVLDRNASPEDAAARAELVGRPSHPSVEFFRMFPGAAGFTLGTAVRMSASFPYFSPAAALPTTPVRHLVDAGYYDNYGTFAATRWVMEQARWLNVARPAAPGGKDRPPWRAEFQNPEVYPEVVLLQVRCFAFEQDTRRYVRKEEEDGVRPPRLLDLTAPVHGLLAVRRAQMVFRGDERVDGTRSLLARREEVGSTEQLVRLRRVLVECRVDPSLNWVLTADTRRRLRADVYHQVEGGTAAPPDLAGFLEALRDQRRAEGLN